MTISTEPLSLSLLTRPTSEPITLAEAKNHLRIAESETGHDFTIANAIREAREQWEHDTDSACCYQTWTLKTNEFCDGLRLPKRPLSSVTHIKYYDGNNTLQTLSSTVYSVDPSQQRIHLAYQQSLPTSIERWDAWTYTYVVGHSEDGVSVPAIAKRAMLLLVGHYFENVDMLMSTEFQSMRAYEALVRRFQRSCYP